MLAISSQPLLSQAAHQEKASLPQDWAAFNTSLLFFDDLERQRRFRPKGSARWDADVPTAEAVLFATFLLKKASFEPERRVDYVSEGIDRKGQWSARQRLRPILNLEVFAHGHALFTFVRGQLPEVNSLERGQVTLAREDLL